MIISAPAEKSEKFNTKAADFSLHAEQLCRVAEVPSTDCFKRMRHADYVIAFDKLYCFAVLYKVL